MRAVNGIVNGSTCSPPCIQNALASQHRRRSHCDSCPSGVTPGSVAAVPGWSLRLSRAGIRSRRARLLAQAPQQRRDLDATGCVAITHKGTDRKSENGRGRWARTHTALENFIDQLLVRRRVGQQQAAPKGHVRNQKLQLVGATRIARRKAALPA